MKSQIYGTLHLTTTSVDMYSLFLSGLCVCVCVCVCACVCVCVRVCVCCTNAAICYPGTDLPDAIPTSMKIFCFAGNDL